MIGKLHKLLSKNIAEWGLPASGSWRFWLYNNSHPHCSHLDVMWFHNGGEFPRLITKLDRKPEILAREFSNLERAYSYAPAFVPRPVSFGNVDGLWALWIEGLPGSPFHPDSSARSLRPVVEMLIDIHSRVRTQSASGVADRYRTMVAEPLDSLAEFGASAVVRKGCAELRRRLGTDWLAALPVIPQHGDFYPGNVIAHQGKMRVIDWESFGQVDLPAYDLFTFLISLIAPDESGPVDHHSATALQTPELTGLYAQKLGLAREDMEFLLPLTLANWFHLMKTDGRQIFTERMYGIMENYLKAEDLWRNIFLPQAGKPA
jgi:aminoglycoside phosphotransferase (APT) family kinase protein